MDPVLVEIECLLDPALQRRRCLPAESLELGDIDQLLVHALRLGEIVDELSTKTQHVGDRAVIIKNAVIVPEADIEVLRKIREPRGGGKNEVRKVAGIHEFPTRLPGAPDIDSLGSRFDRFGYLSDDPRDHVRLGRIELIVTTIEIARDDRLIVEAGRLSTDIFTEAGARYLGDRVAFIGRLQLAGQDSFLAKRIGRLARIHAGTANI